MKLPIIRKENQKEIWLKSNEHETGSSFLLDRQEVPLLWFLLPIIGTLLLIGKHIPITAQFFPVISILRGLAQQNANKTHKVPNTWELLRKNTTNIVCCVQ